MTTPAPETLAGGRFTLLEVLGEGGMARVYRAFDRRLQRYRAIKILAPQLAMKENLRRRFLAEAQTMATLEESRVVRVFDMGEDEGRVYIVMELVEGGSLVDRINGAGPLPPQLTAQVGLQIAESLHVAHVAGVIHRDIKPHNILLTKAGEIRITDFGIAQVHSDSGDGMTRTGAVMGTWGFMAPEQRNNAKGVDARADVFSTGATMWALLRGETPPELYAEEAAFDGIPEALATVLRRATRYRREERYATALQLADALREALTLLPPDPEFVPPLVLPKEARTVVSPPESYTIDPAVDSAPSAGTMVPDHGPDPSLVLKRPATQVTEVGPEPGGPAPKGSLPPPDPGDPSPRGTLPSRSTFDADLPSVARPGVWMAGVAFAALAFLGLAVLGTGAWWVHRGQAVVAPSETSAGADDPGASVSEGPLAAQGIGVEPPVVDPAADPAVAAAQPAADASAEPPTPSSHTTRPPRSASSASSPDASPSATPDNPVEPPAVEPTRTTVTATPATSAPTGLVHTPPASVSAGGAVTLTATGGAGWTVKVYYRPAAGGGYSNKLMNASGTTYSATLKATDDLAGGIEYFLQATTPGGMVKDGSAAAPHRIAIAGE